MKQSFITPQHKNILGAELKWLLATSATLVVVMVVSSLFLNTIIRSTQEELVSLTSKHSEIKTKQKEMRLELSRLELLATMSEAISTKNRLQKENVKNFFDLVPNDVILTLAEFRDGTLYLKGHTVSVKRYKNGFERSLKSLFKGSTTTFKKSAQGGYTFNNISILEEK